MALLGFYDLGRSVTPTFHFRNILYTIISTCPFKALIAIFWDLQPMWPCSLTKSDFLRFKCSSGHVLSKTKSVTPIPFFFTILASLTCHLSLVKFSDKNQR